MPRNLIVIVQDRSPLTQIFQMNIRTRQSQVQTIKFDILKATNFDPLFKKLSTCANLKRVKAFAFFVADSDFPAFSDGYKFRLKCREFCESHGIFCYITALSSLVTYVAINQTKTMVSEGEEVFVIFASDLGFIFATTVVREGKAYRISKDHQSVVTTLTKSWKKSFIGTSKPKKIILVRFSDTCWNELEKVFEEDKPEIYEMFYTQTLFNQAMVDKVLHLMGVKINEYEVHFLCQDVFVMSYNGASVIVATAHIALPYKNSVIVDVDPSKTITFYGRTTTPNHPPEFLESFSLSKIKTKKAKIIFKVDINSFYDINIEPYNGKKPAQGIEKLDVSDCCCVDLLSFPTKTKFIFDKQNFSVIACKSGSERAMKNHDGLDKTPTYIAFVEKKPIIGKAAMEAYGSKPKFVVSDLMKLCSISSTDVMNPKWGFRLSKENDTIMVTMQTVDGERKSSATFLLALILKEALSIVKKDTGEKLEQVEIGFDGLAPNNILKKNFVEAGKLVKVDIVFGLI
uniref:Uncharacterized protein n=1 Tax=Panagrolaimus sp. ES5 TaxID=591445 RepID=A0AC34GTB3_9BILA